MAGSFHFAIRNRDLPRLDALRRRMGTDYWPDAAFAIFRSAREASLRGGAIVPIRPSICAAAICAKQAHSNRHVSPVIAQVQKRNADPVIVAFLGDVARHYGLPDARVAAMALVSAWVAAPKCWSGAPVIGGDA